MLNKKRHSNNSTIKGISISKRKVVEIESLKKTILEKKEKK